MLYKIPYIRPLVRFHKSSATSNHTFLTVRVIIISMSLFGFLAKFLKKALVFVLCQVGFGMTGVLAGKLIFSFWTIFHFTNTQIWQVTPWFRFGCSHCSGIFGRTYRGRKFVLYLPRTGNGRSFMSEMNCRDPRWKLFFWPVGPISHINVTDSHTLRSRSFIIHYKFPAFFGTKSGKIWALYSNCRFSSPLILQMFYFLLFVGWSDSTCWLLS